MASGVFVVAFGLAVWSEEVAALGIELLDPIVRHPPTADGGWGGWAGRRAAGGLRGRGDPGGRRARRSWNQLSRIHIGTPHSAIDRFGIRDLGESDIVSSASRQRRRRTR